MGSDGWGQAHWEGLRDRLSVTGHEWLADPILGLWEALGDRLSVTGREWIADQILGLGFRLVCGLGLENRQNFPRSVEPSRLSPS